MSASNGDITTKKKPLTAKEARLLLGIAYDHHIVNGYSMIPLTFYDMRNFVAGLNSIWLEAERLKTRQGFIEPESHNAEDHTLEGKTPPSGDYLVFHREILQKHGAITVQEARKLCGLAIAFFTISMGPDIVSHDSHVTIAELVKTLGLENYLPKDQDEQKRFANNLAARLGIASSLHCDYEDESILLDMNKLGEIIKQTTTGFTRLSTNGDGHQESNSKGRS